METFPWSTIGEPTSIDVEDFVDTLRTPYSGGYVATRAKNSAVLKRFIINWDVMDADQWYALLEFWRSHGSSLAFFFQFPYDLYTTATPTEFGGVSAEPSGFNSSVSYGSRIFVVRFLEDTLKQTRVTKIWSAEVVVEESFSATIGTFSSSSSSSESV